MQQNQLSSYLSYSTQSSFLTMQWYSSTLVNTTFVFLMYRNHENGTYGRMTQKDRRYKNLQKHVF